MSKELDFLETFFQTAIDKIVSNLNTMKDSKGHNRNASGVTGQLVGEADGRQIKEYTDKWVVQIYMPKYYEFIDEGVKGWANTKKNTGRFSFKKGNKPIPRKVILDWMMSRTIVYKGFVGDRAKKRKGIAPKPSIKDKLNQLAYLIGRSIKKKGIEGVPFYSSVMSEDFFKSFETEFLDVYGDKVLNDIAFIFKETKP